MRRIAATVLLVVLVAGCGSDDDEGGEEADAGTVSVTAADISFTPTELELEPGKTVVIEVENTGQLEHNLTIDELGVDRDVEGGQSVRVPVTPEAGTYTFICKYHPGQMTGTITVA